MIWVLCLCMCWCVYSLLSPVQFLQSQSPRIQPTASFSFPPPPLAPPLATHPLHHSQTTWLRWGTYYQPGTRSCNDANVFFLSCPWWPHEGVEVLRTQPSRDPGGCKETAAREWNRQGTWLGVVWWWSSLCALLVADCGQSWLEVGSLIGAQLSQSVLWVILGFIGAALWQLVHLMVTFKCITVRRYCISLIISGAPFK